MTAKRPPDNRTRDITVRVTPDEHAHFTLKAERLSMRLSQLARLALDAYAQPKPVTEALVREIVEEVFVAREARR